MKGFIEYLIASIEEVEKEIKQDIKKEISEKKKNKVEDNDLYLHSILID